MEEHKLRDGYKKEESKYQCKAYEGKTYNYKLGKKIQDKIM